MDLKKYKKKRIVPRGWKEITIGDVFRTSSGATPLSTEVSYYANGTIPWINSGELDNPYIYDTTNFISQKGFENSSTEIYPIDTVLVAMYGATAGKASILKMEACTNQAVCAILPNKEYSSIFLKYSIDTLYDHLVGLSSGSARDNLSQTELKKLKLIMPVTKREQDNIVSILSLIDRKIELNRLINQNLEAMAKQLYDYWFVQFDFPDENGRPYKSSGGKMVWNEKLKREIPEGWDSIPIGNYAPCKGGYAFKSSDFCKRRGVPVIKIGNIRDDYTLDMTDCQCIENFDNSQFLAKRFDLVIAMTGATIGKFAISQRDYWVNQRVGRFELGDTPLNRLGYLFNSLKQDYFREQIFQIASGCAQPNISSEQIDAILILKPKDSILSQFNNICRSLLKQQSENLLQIEELTKQRDELLPFLMNGQVSVNSDLSDD